MAKWIAFGALTGVWLFGAGFLIGRQIPAHHFERFGNTTYLVDTSTGLLCDALPPAGKPPAGFEIVNPNPIDQALTGSNHVPPCLAAK